MLKIISKNNLRGDSFDHIEGKGNFAVHDSYCDHVTTTTINGILTHSKMLTMGPLDSWWSERMRNAAEGGFRNDGDGGTGVL